MGRALQLMVLLGGLVWIGVGGPVRAAGADRLADVLRLGEIVDVMRQEGQAFGRDLSSDRLEGQGGIFWADRVARIYDRSWMKQRVRDALERGMSDDQIARAIAFFETPAGQRILTLETTARQAMTDPELEQVARAAYGGLKGTADARLAAVARFIEVNDLLERNVAGALSTNFHFMRGMVQGGASQKSEAEIVANVWSQEAETRAETESWLFGFLLLAYRPLSDRELDDYILFSQTPSGRALNAALFDGFDHMYRDISHALGLLVARTAASSDL